ncbi:hypothetical protein [Chitinophaga caseinilytica]|uniref:hypothetical protein n=1 Tax=Chitinophaga caseinilytica TaxID=2267521 RepID=UPI003C2E2C43
MNKRLLLLLTILIVLSAGILVAMPVIRKLTVSLPASPAVAAETETFPAADLAVLEELGGLFHRLDNITAFEVTGTVTAFDPSDGAGKVQMDYRYARLDSLVYYQLGQQETVSNTEMLLMIDHKAEKIFVSGPQRFSPGLFPSSTILANFLTGEGYNISRKTKGGLNWIILQRPNHISCKDYRVGFDQAGFIRQTFMRITDISDPLNDAKDKIMEATADRWTIADPAGATFDVTRFVTRSQGGLTPAPAYKNYALILTQ